MSSNLIYFRMVGYVATIAMHSINMVSMVQVLHTQEAVDLLEDPTVKFFHDNQARFFTCWTFFLQIVYAIIGLACDFFTLKNSHKEHYKLNVHLRRFRDTLFSAIQWPSTLVVSSLFWSLYHVDRELIFPRVLDKVLTRTSNHVIHTAIVPVVVWELIFRPRPEPRSHLWNLAHLVFHYLLYFSVVFYTYYVDGEWMYPVFKQTWGSVLFPVFMIGIVILVLIYYYIQWPITRLIHGSVEKKKNKLR